MDFEKRKLLTQSVGYLQANLTVTSKLLTTLKDKAVLTDSEISTVKVGSATPGSNTRLITRLILVHLFPIKIKTAKRPFHIFQPAALPVTPPERS